MCFHTEGVELHESTHSWRELHYHNVCIAVSDTAVWVYTWSVFASVWDCGLLKCGCFSCSSASSYSRRFSCLLVFIFFLKGRLFLLVSIFLKLYFFLSPLHSCFFFSICAFSFLLFSCPISSLEVWMGRMLRFPAGSHHSGCQFWLLQDSGLTVNKTIWLSWYIISLFMHYFLPYLYLCIPLSPFLFLKNYSC